MPVERLFGGAWVVLGEAMTWTRRPKVTRNGRVNHRVRTRARGKSRGR
jgi:hypothetical protein